jgi:hypothetical protein
MLYQFVPKCGWVVQILRSRHDYCRFRIENCQAREMVEWHLYGDLPKSRHWKPSREVWLKSKIDPFQKIATVRVPTARRCKLPPLMHPPGPAMRLDCGMISDLWIELDISYKLASSQKGLSAEQFWNSVLPQPCSDARKSPNSSSKNIHRTTRCLAHHDRNQNCKMSRVGLEGLVWWSNGWLIFSGGASHSLALEASSQIIAR